MFDISQLSRDTADAARQHFISASGELSVLVDNKRTRETHTELGNYEIQGTRDQERLGKYRG